MIFEIFYHVHVVKEDIPRLDSSIQIKIQKAIEQKLVTDPLTFGKPLRRSLAGYRKLRVGDYRVIFRIKGKKVLIILIRHRRDSYLKVSKRL